MSTTYDGDLINERKIIEIYVCVLHNKQKWNVKIKNGNLLIKVNNGMLSTWLLENDTWRRI